MNLAGENDSPGAEYWVAVARTQSLGCGFWLSFIVAAVALAGMVSMIVRAEPKRNLNHEVPGKAAQWDKARDCSDTQLEHQRI